MSKRTRVDANHDRITSDDGRTSRLVETPGWFQQDRTVELTDHHEDGTSDSYELASFAQTFLQGGDGRGDKK